MSSDEDEWISHREHNYDVNSRIMLIAIVSLSFVILAVTFLHIYARCLLRRQARRQAAFAHLDLFTISIEPSAAADPPRTGLEPAVIAALPVFAFKQILIDNDGDGDREQLIGPTECSVCLSMLEDGELARALPNCKHTFHADCIDKWFGSNSTCPICRTEAQPRLVAEPREGVTGLHPSAPPLEATSSDRMQIAGKMIGSTAGPSSSSRLSSFRRIIERSSRRMQSQSSDNGLPDLERQQQQQ